MKLRSTAFLLARCYGSDTNFGIGCRSFVCLSMQDRNRLKPTKLRPGTQHFAGAGCRLASWRSRLREAFQRYAARFEGFHVLPIYGGQSYTPQIQSLRRGVQVVGRHTGSCHGPYQARHTQARHAEAHRAGDHFVPIRLTPTTCGYCVPRPLDAQPG